MDVDYVTPAMNQCEAAAARADNLYIRFSIRRIKPQQLLQREKWKARATNLEMEMKAGEGKIKKEEKKESIHEYWWGEWALTRKSMGKSAGNDACRKGDAWPVTRQEPSNELISITMQMQTG